MIIHKTLASGRWFEFSFIEQMANIGCDVERTIQWRKKGDSEHSRKAFERALELLHFTIADPKNKKRLREITRVKETLIDYFMFYNKYSSSDEAWQKYFFNFNYMAALQKGR